ncbi:hypothetical protein [Aeromonas diversa]|uniref:hypothetical protein n=1 Tax=Aeromonas diversa TaxID=502790 RepID=UPI0034629E68
MKALLLLLVYLFALSASAAEQARNAPPEGPREMPAEMKAALEACKENGRPLGEAFDSCMERKGFGKAKGGKAHLEEILPGLGALA